MSLKSQFLVQADSQHQVCWDPHFAPRVGETEQHTGNDGNKPLHRVEAVAPLYSFTTWDQFRERQEIGTWKEFMLEKQSIDVFNEEEYSFKAWPIVYISQLNNSAMLLFFLEPSSHDAMLPREGEACDIVVPKFGKSPATRVDNPCSLWRIRDDALEKCLALEISRRWLMELLFGLNEEHVN